MDEIDSSITPGMTDAPGAGWGRRPPWGEGGEGGGGGRGGEGKEGKGEKELSVLTLSCGSGIVRYPI